MKLFPQPTIIHFETKYFGTVSAEVTNMNKPIYLNFPKKRLIPSSLSKQDEEQLSKAFQLPSHEFRSHIRYVGKSSYDIILELSFMLCIQKQLILMSIPSEYEQRDHSHCAT
jgi:hypothetical protein